MKTFFLTIKKGAFLQNYLWLFLILIPFSSSFSQNFCRPDSQTNSVGGLLCVGMSVTTPDDAFDGNMSTFASISNVLGLACFAQETLHFNQTAKAGDQIVVYFNTGNGVLDAEVLSNGTIQAKNGVANVGPAVALNSGILNLQILDDVNKIGVIKYTLPGDANSVQIQSGGLLSAFLSLRIYEVRLQFAKPTIVGGNTQAVCSGQSISLTATAAAGTTLAWYDSPTSTTALSNTNTFTTPALTVAKTYYVSSSRNAGCESDERVPVTINITNPVLPTIDTSGTVICSTGPTQSTTLSVINPIPGTIYSWYSSVGAFIASGNTLIRTVPIGVSNFFVEAAIGACKTPTRTPVSVTSNPVPAAPIVLTQSVSILSGQNATLSASSTDPSVTFDWYDTATGGTKLFTNSPTYTTPILTANKTYYVEAVSAAGGCVSATRVAINVTVLANPLGGCLDANSQQTNQNGLCLFCSSNNPNNSVDGSSSTAARLSVPVGLVNGWIQQTLQFNNPGQAGDVITVDLEIPTGLLDISALSYISLATYNGATYNNDRIAVNSSLLNIQLLTGNRFKASLTAGSAFDRVEIRLGGLATLLTSLDIYGASYKFKARTITGNTTICNGQATTLTSSASLDETIKWYDALTGGTLLSSTTAYTTPALTANTTYYVEVTRNGCVNSERFPVVVTVNNPVAPTTVVASPVNICSGQTATITVQSPVAGTDYKWYSTASGGTSLFTGTSFTTPSLTATTSYHVEAAIGSCLSATRTQVTVNVNPRPAVPTVALSNVFIQGGQSVTLEVSNPVGGIDYDWYDAPTNGNLLASATTSYTPSPALTVNKSFYITAKSTATGCISDTRAVINVIISNSINSCLLANSQVTSRGGATNCLLCGSSNDGDSVDGNNSTAAHLSIPVGLLGDYMQQVLSFPTVGEAGDIIDVELGIPVGLLDISALSNISLQSFNSGLPNSDQSNISSLLNVQILGGNRFRASFVAAGAFTSVQIKLEGLATLLAGVDIYEASYRYPNATINGAATPICEGQSTTLTATATGTQTFSWYDVPTGGTALATNTNTYATGPLTGTKIFYLEASRGVTPCLNTNRQAITVTVLPLPTDADIAITTPLTASCVGGAVLTPTATLAGATFKYYIDQNKSLEIVSGTVAGVTYLKDATTGALTISGLIASNSPYKYYISVLNGGTCENVNGTLKEVVVNYPVGSALTVTATLAGCAKVNLKDAITNFDTSGNTTYTFFDAANAPITDQAATNITIGGDYWIQAQTAGVDCPSVKEKVTVTINPLPTLIVTTNSQVVNKGDSVALVATSNGTITWYDPAGNPIPSNNTGALNTVGVFTYTVIVSNGTCTDTQTITITVIDPASCDPLLEREYATTQQWSTIITGGVTNAANGADGNPKTYSTITTGIGLLGIGTTWQNLQWPTTIAKGTPVTVKLGAEYSGVALGQGVTVIGTKRDGLGNPIDIGTLQSVSGSLLNLLSGQNSFEYTFVPSDISGPKAYDGIRVQMGSILGIAQNINVYDAYYDKTVTQITCGQGDIEDVFFGVKEIGVGALTATVGVSNAWNIADNDVATYATMFSGVGVLAAAQLTATFRTPSMVGDSLRIIISKPGTVLNLNLLTGFNIQLYLGNTAVGAPILNDSNLLTLKLLSGDTMAMTILAPQTQPYDRVTISFGGVVSVLDQLRVHNIDRVTNTKVIGGDDDNNVTVCPGSTITLQVPPANCSTYKWYDSPTGGNFLTDGQTYTIPATLAAGTYKYYIQPIRYGCPALARGVVTVIVRPTTLVNIIEDVKINDGTETIICAGDGKVKLEAVLAATPVLTGVVYHWYSFDGTNSNLIVGETASVLNLTGLTAGTYTYYLGVSSDQYCETAPGDRKQITFTILPNSLVTDITVNNDSVCHNTDAVFTPESTLTNPKFFWYFDTNKTQPIPNGPGPITIAGVTYTTSSLGVLTVSGLTALMSPVTYYVAVSSDNTCENKEGELKAATVTISSPATPTTTDDTPNFCLANNPTVANLQVNEPNVVWYDSLISTTPLLASTPLTSKAYYGAISIPIKTNPIEVYCESAVRLVVTVTVTDPAKPTTNDDTQDFCLANNPTVANLQVNETGVVWYSSLVSVTPLDPTTALANGPYYGAILDPVTGCVSSVRLLVTVTVTDPAKPTTNDDTQDFCLANNPTVANLQVNETGVVWYSSLVSVTPLDPTTALANGPYYGAILDPVTGCVSSVRLLVTVTVTDPAKPTTNDDTQDFCLANNPTVANLQVNETGVVWYSSLVSVTPLDPTTALANGPYYGAILDPVTGCVSSVRLLVTVTVTDPAKPTTNDDTQDFCLANNPTVANLQVNETGVVWYSSLVSVTPLDPTTALANGPYYGAILDPVTGCVSSVRLLVTVTVTDPVKPTTNDDTQDFCLANNPTVANLQVNETGVVWYSSLVSVTPLDPTTALANGPYYGAILDPVTGCVSSVRLLVTVTVTDPAKPTTNDDTQDFCLANNPTVANLQVNETGVVWYSSLVSVTPLDPTTALANGPYYGAILDPVTGCVSSVRLLVTVTVTDPVKPTTNDDTQDFCLANNPTVANLQVNETGVVWYSSLVSVTPLDPTTALANGPYYGAILDPVTGCVSSVRLLVTVTVTDPAKPTTNDDTQDFCLANNPTVANLQVNETGVVWYSSLVSVTPLDPTTALANGPYYGAILDPVTGCVSSVRLLVTVTVTDPVKPTTNDDTQDFCLANNPTVANLQVNETGVVWYSSLVSVTPLDPTTALANGPYYGAILDPVTGCVSSVRLLVTVTVTDPAKPTTNDDTQDFCLANNPTVANLQVNETGVVWYSSLVSVTPLDPTTALANGPYYGAILDPVTGCVSSVRLLVTVTVTDPAKPTTSDDTQEFCLVNDPKVSDIQTNETGVVWYTSSTGGTALTPETLLTNGRYYGAILDPITGCESKDRLLVSVTVNDGPRPTTTRATQDFCLTAQPKVSDLQVNEVGVVWYNVETGGTPLAPGTLLVAGTYYASLKDPITGCESKLRLAIPVTFRGNAIATITESKAAPCVFDEITYTTLSGMSNYNWTITGGGTVTGGGTATDNFVTVTWPAIGPASVNVSYTNQCNETNSKLLTLAVATCSDITMSKTVDNPTPNINDKVTFTVTVNNVGSGNFIDTIVSEILPTGYDFISAQTTTGTYSNITGAWNIPVLNANQSAVLTVVVQVLPTGNYLNVASIVVSNPIDSDTTNNHGEASVSPVCLVVYNEFTPNNDGANDVFKIDCIENYPNNSLNVYNRYGALVYKQNHYNNDWDGIANVSGAINKGDKLPAGTYYYVLDIGADGVVKTGWLSIIR